MSNTFNVPTREEVSENNQVIFDQLEKGIGFVPNLFATYTYNETALADYLALSNRKSTLSAKEKEVINLTVSQVNDCLYCLSAHTAIGKMNGFTEEQILEIRGGEASFDEKLDALAKFSRNVTINRSKPDPEVLSNLFNAGYDKANLIDILMMIGDKTISNFINGVTQIPVDFPVAKELEVVA
ncbi:MAG: carboxymuconolactone decarboxylase family protein [Cyclobacteriaceae bacterium]